MSTFSTGSPEMDEFLDGGYCSEHINTIYGPGATGKTTLVLMAAISQVESGKKVIFIDTGHGFSLERVKQLTPDYQKIVDNILLFTARSFKEQMKSIKSASALAKNDSVGLIVVDTIGSHYRREVSMNHKFVNKCLDIQLSILKNLAQSGKANILLTNQVSDNIKAGGVQIVGGEMLINWSKLVIELKKHLDGKRELCLKKHPSAEIKSALFEINNNGIDVIKIRRKS